MRPFKLDLDALHLESFAVGEARSGTRGTVRAHGPDNTLPPDTTNATDAVACATQVLDWCGPGETANGCVEYTTGNYEITPLC